MRTNILTLLRPEKCLFNAMHNKRIITVLILIVTVSTFYGCGGRYALIYPSNDSIVFLSKKNPPLRFELPGTNWLFSQPDDSQAVFRQKGPKLKQVKLQYMSLKNADWYVPEMSNEVFLEKHYQWEEKFLKKDPYLKVKVEGRNFEGPGQPNLMWITEGKDFKAYAISFIKNEKQIVLLAVGGLPNKNGKESLLHLFHSLEFLSEAQVDEIAKSEASYFEPLSSYP